MNRFRPQYMRSDRLEGPKRCNTVPYVVVNVKLITEKPRMLYVVPEAQTTQSREPLLCSKHCSQPIWMLISNQS